MNFCSNCAAPVILKIPPGDDRSRYICDSCGSIFYSNPKLVVGCIPEWEEKILLCKRAIEPRRGKWTLPAGYLENEETAAAGARRETLEEAEVILGEIEPYALFDLPFVSQIYFMFRGPMVENRFGSGEESLEVDLFTEAEIPWDEIAFTVIKETLQRYFRDRAAGRGFPFQMGTISVKPFRGHGG